MALRAHHKQLPDSLTTATERRRYNAARMVGMTRSRRSCSTELKPLPEETRVEVIYLSSSRATASKNVW